LSEEILINVTPQETRVAIVENGVLQEVHVERADFRGIVGNLYMGKVMRVLPGMQAAFVDIGLKRTGFLHASDIICRDSAFGKDSSASEVPPVSELLHEGERVLVQVVKDPIGTKGARLTTQVSIPSRYLVYLPGETHIGISQRIDNEDERTRLRDTMERILAEEGIEGGLIIRTVADVAVDEELLMEIRFLRKVWERADDRSKNVKAPGIVYEDTALAIRAMRDMVRGNVDKVRIDSRETYEKALAFARELIPEVAGQIEYYPGERPIFDLYSVEDEIERALGKKVHLKSGGYLVFDQTEAMTTVDVNTGAYTGRQNLEETLFKTNLEATQTIARQIRLRNCGGIIIIDFIDMQDTEHKRQVLRSLEHAVARDRVKTFVTEMSQLGLVEVTRKRTRESLEQVLCEPCPICEGRGVQKTPLTICYQIFREILREVRQYDTHEYRLLASQVVIDLLLDEEADRLADLQEFVNRPIHLQVDTSFHQEQYDIVPM
jgi:ribonuclease G